MAQNLRQGAPFVPAGDRHFDLRERAEQKRRSREQDQKDLESGAKTREDLRRENGWLSGIGSHTRIDWSKVK